MELILRYTQDRPFDASTRLNINASTRLSINASSFLSIDPEVHRWVDILRSLRASALRPYPADLNI
jgi:hypothetical protein